MFKRQPNRALVEQLTTAGMEPDAAAEAIEKVFAAVRVTLTAGKTVSIPGVGTLSAPEKQDWVPGYHGRKIHRFRRARFRPGDNLCASEPWEPIR